MPEWSPEIVVDEALARRLLAAQFPELEPHGGPVVPGQELADADLDDTARAARARPLGRFLRALHSAEIDVELPVDPLRRADMGFRVGLARDRLAELGDRLGRRLPCRPGHRPRPRLERATAERAAELLRRVRGGVGGRPPACPGALDLPLRRPRAPRAAGGPGTRRTGIARRARADARGVGGAPERSHLPPSRA